MCNVEAIKYNSNQYMQCQGTYQSYNLYVVLIVDNLTGDPLAAGPRAGDSWAGGPQAGGPQAGGPQAGGPQAAGPQAGRHA